MYDGRLLPPLSLSLSLLRLLHFPSDQTTTPLYEKHNEQLGARAVVKKIEVAVVSGEVHVPHPVRTPLDPHLLLLSEWIIAALRANTTRVQEPHDDSVLSAFTLNAADTQIEREREKNHPTFVLFFLRVYVRQSLSLSRRRQRKENHAPLTDGGVPGKRPQQPPHHYHQQGTVVLVLCTASSLLLISSVPLFVLSLVERCWKRSTAFLSKRCFSSGV